MYFFQTITWKPGVLVGFLRSVSWKYCVIEFDNLSIINTLRTNSCPRIQVCSYYLCQHKLHVLIGRQNLVLLKSCIVFSYLENVLRTLIRGADICITFTKH